MSSLDHLLCPRTIDQPSHFDNMSYSNRNDSSSPPQGNMDSKPNPRRCSVPACQKTAKRGGRCISHGGGNKCVIDGCTTSVVSRGLCVAHGGGKRCQTPECVKSAQSGGYCWVHGGGKKCGYHGCPKRAQSGGACIAHGGGKRCRTDGCNKVVQYDGLCVGHGGYRRCVVEVCDRRAMANDYCQQHGGSSVCTLEHCYKRAVRGGMCSEHKAEASHQEVTSNGLSTPSQSSDNARDRKRKIPEQTTIYRPTTSEWRSRMDLKEVANKLSPDFCLPTPCLSRHFQMKNNSTGSPPPTNKGTHSTDESQLGISLITPGFSALPNADNKLSSFSAFTKKLDSIERYSRPHQLLHQEHKVYPILPGIHVLQKHSKTSSGHERTSMTWSESATTTTTEDNSKFRMLITEDPLERLAHAEKDYRDDSTMRKFYVRCSYYKKGDEMLECTKTQTRQHDWSRHHP